MHSTADWGANYPMPKVVHAWLGANRSKNNSAGIRQLARARSAEAKRIQREGASPGHQ